mmetsp:Transcript_201/g.177  ORF Transcript_201/g.177 Transcript_201/m.177 type:complete len:110 (-) Transcript_201:851-1180(-)|eukprot:CAMPEP_0114582070 /NCGR_PEP_ID=MMETSP0125-20121206/6100_1 /TAXON_ID=485358 ORGANISM="Aristerostoma sp., Strain ATCC 50986" /NCGR_SAMPLE_ID=MMETSP0125 /ASSEMBLY_ACC=CAM_ASM_000245 /LENGTH=109 /DNA_ID=CAMNT_0001774753 /DNA_START=378 /DNA_END=707 /DNA_ORIENTATION=-
MTVPQYRSLYKGKPLVPVLAKPADVKCFLEDPIFKNSEIWIKVNTGMNRLGLTLDELKNEVIPMLKAAKDSRPDGARVQHLMQHFSVADMLTEEAKKITKQQLDNFEIA